jgi:DNA-binding transcriptional LysR family regulator
MEIARGVSWRAPLSAILVDRSECVKCILPIPPMHFTHATEMDMSSLAPKRRLSGIDLNLLVVLDALLAESNVTNAAKRIGLSQSATSHALSRLRDILDDPILIRTPQGMVPTSFGRALARPVQDILRRCEAALLNSSRFEASSSRDEFRIALDVSAQINVLPALIERIQSEAPGITLKARMLRPERVTRDLELGEIDFAITANTPPATVGIRNELLMSTGPISILCRDNPRAKRRLDLQAFLEMPHVAVERPGVVDLAIDSRLAEQSLARRVVLTVETPVPIPALVARSNLVATVPLMLVARSDFEAMNLVAHEPPLELSVVRVYLTDHEQTRESAAHQWLRGAIVDVFRTLDRHSVGRRSRRRE